MNPLDRFCPVCTTLTYAQDSGRHVYRAPFWWCPSHAPRPESSWDKPPRAAPAEAPRVHFLAAYASGAFVACDPTIKDGWAADPFDVTCQKCREVVRWRSEQVPRAAPTEAAADPGPDVEAAFVRLFLAHGAYIRGGVAGPDEYAPVAAAKAALLAAVSRPPTTPDVLTAARAVIEASRDPYHQRTGRLTLKLDLAIGKLDLALLAAVSRPPTTGLPLDLMEHARSLMLNEAAARHGTLSEDRLRLVGWLSRLDAAIREARRGVIAAPTTDADALRAEVERLRAALARLVALKEEKDAHGKTEHYLREQPKAWAEARALFPSPDATRPSTWDVSKPPPHTCDPERAADFNCRGCRYDYWNEVERVPPPSPSGETTPPAAQDPDKERT